MSIDLYAIYQLDRTQPPEILAQQLTERLSATDPSDSLTRGRIETAQAILGDPSRRAVYDAQLGDPAAPPITEQALAALAGRPVPSAPSITLTSVLASTRGKLIAGGAAALVLILLLVIAVAAVRGGDDEGGVAATTPSQTEPAPTLSNPDVSKINGFYGRPGTQQILVTAEVDLTDEVTELGFQSAKDGRYTGPELSPDRNGWPADAYSTEMLLLRNGQISLKWACDAVDGPRQNVDPGAFCDRGEYLVLLDQGASADEAPTVAKATAGTPTEIADEIYETVGRETANSRVWPGNASSPVPPEVMVDGQAAQVIAAVQPDMDEPLVYFVMPQSFKVYVGEMAARPKAAG